MKPTFAYAATYEGRNPQILVWTIRGTAKQVRQVVGEAWCEENPRDGWRAAVIEQGYKVTKVQIAPVQ